MGAFQPWHLIVIAIVGAFLFFGWKHLPDMSRSVGRSLRVFKTEIKGMNEDDKARDAAASDKEAGRTDAQAVTPKTIEAPVQRPTPRADVVPNPAAQPVRTRPRPAPSPNGRANSR